MRRLATVLFLQACQATVPSGNKGDGEAPSGDTGALTGDDGGIDRPGGDAGGDGGADSGDPSSGDGGADTGAGDGGGGGDAGGDAGADTGAGDGGGDAGGDAGGDTGGDTGGDAGGDTGGDAGGTDTGGGGDTGSAPDPFDPCSVVLPADTIVETGFATHASDDVWVLVCRNSTVSFTGDQAHVVVEAGGGAIVNGADLQAWVLTRGELLLQGTDARVGAERTGDVDDRSSGATVTACTSITVDTSALPGGC